MATFTETKVAVTVTLAMNEDGTKHAYLSGVSYAADGTRLRGFPETEVTAQLPQAQRDEAIDLLAAAAAYLKSLYGIA